MYKLPYQVCFHLAFLHFLQKYNLDNVNILIPIQKTIYEEQDETFNYQDGTYEILTKENVTKYLKGEKYFHDDFLIMDSNIKNILVVDKVADCPMLILLAKINNFMPWRYRECSFAWSFKTNARNKGIFESSKP